MPSVRTTKPSGDQSLAREAVGMVGHRAGCQGSEPAPAFSWSLMTFGLRRLREDLGEHRATAEEPEQCGCREVVDVAVPGRDHPGEIEHLLQLLAGVLLVWIAELGLMDAVFQERDRRVHLAALALGHDDPECLHDVLEGLEIGRAGRR